MTIEYRAAVLHGVGAPMAVEPVIASGPAGNQVLVRIKAAGLCHTDLEVITGSLRYPLPIVLGHEAAGIVEELGPTAHGLRVGDHVVLSWNPHCGHCFYCDRDLPILCESYLAHGPGALAFDGTSRTRLGDGRELKRLMFIGAFAEYAVVADHQAIVVPEALSVRSRLPHWLRRDDRGRRRPQHCDDRLWRHGHGDRLRRCRARRGAGRAAGGCGRDRSIDKGKLALAERVGATSGVDARREDPGAAAKAKTAGRGADVVIEAAGNAASFRASLEAVRPGGEVIWLGKTDVAQDVAFRWGSLMGEKRIRRSSYGGARPARDFPLLAHAYLDGRLKLDELITRHIALDEINEGFAALQRGEAIRSVIVF